MAVETLYNYEDEENSGDSGKEDDQGFENDLPDIPETDECGHDSDKEKLDESFDSGVDLTEFDEDKTVAEVLQTLEREDYGNYDLQYDGEILPRHKQLRFLNIPRKAKVVKVQRKLNVKGQKRGTESDKKMDIKEEPKIESFDGISLADFDDDKTVADILQVLERENYGNYDLAYNGQILPRHKDLRFLEITRNANVVKVERKLNVNVRNCGTGINIPATVRPSDTVKTLKEQINERGSSSVRANRISFEAREMNDCDTLRQHGVKNGSQLYASPNLVGG